MKINNILMFNSYMLYAIGLLSIVLSVIVCILIKRNKEYIRNNRRLDITFRSVIFFIGMCYLFLPMFFDIVVYNRGLNIEYLPLQICSLTTVFYLIFIYSSKLGVLHRLNFLSAIAGGILALVIVSNNNDPSSIRFWTYYIGHSFIIIAYIYYMYIEESCFTIKDLIYGLIFMGIIMYFIILPFNFLFETGFSFMGPYLYDSSIWSSIFSNWVIYQIVFSIGVIALYLLVVWIIHLYMCRNKTK